MLKIIFISFIAIFFISCGDSGDADFVVNNSNSENNISKDDKLAKNPNYEIYDDKCEQTENPSLCGYVGTDGPPSLPCRDKTYCLPE